MLMQTNDPVLVSFVEALMRDAGIHVAVADANMSVLEGSIGILPKRILVLDEDLEAARRLLEGAELGDWKSSDDA